MGYNYGVERRKFYQKWDRLYQEYVEGGMSEAAIIQLFEFDWAVFKSDRRFLMHNQSIESSFPDSDVAREDNSPLINSQLEHLSVRQPNICEWGRFDWIEDIDTPKLVKQLKSLSQADLELLTYLVVDGLSRAEIARKLNVSRAAITQRINRIKGRLEKVYSQS